VATLWLVGMMGAGKSTVGALVASSLGVPLTDIDRVVEAEAGSSVEQIFDSEGEPAFRRREAKAVAVAAGTIAVVACGGGAVMDGGNTQRMRQTGLVVWLDAPAQVLGERIAGAGGRPLLAGSEVVDRLSAIWAVREPAYAAAAHHRVDTAGRSPEEVAKEVVRLWLSSHSQGAAAS
jgi:shikimate kinase